MSILAALTLLAAGTPGAAAPDAAPATDPVICRRITETGSRLKASRTCLTRSQWADRRREERMAIEQAQTQKAMSGNGTGGT